VSLPELLGHDRLHQAVRERYGRVATEPTAVFGFPVGRAFAEAVGYPADVLERAPGAAASFTGVGTPVRVARLRPGERVLELGCGAGLDTTWAAAEVQPGGLVIAVDLALPMVSATRRNVGQAGGVGVLPIVAQAEALPLPAASVDVVLTNGLLSLAPDKAAVVREIRRVLRPGGRLVMAEVALRASLAPGEASTLDDWFR
jgi:arsenite methyltransferase